MSGSGKSTLINETLYPILILKYNSVKSPLEFKIRYRKIDKVVEVNQQRLEKHLSNPATYTGLYSEIRKLFQIQWNLRLGL